jgi:selenocysteine-specific translation elongation factor
MVVTATSRCLSCVHGGRPGQRLALALAPTAGEQLQRGAQVLQARSSRAGQAAGVQLQEASTVAHRGGAQGADAQVLHLARGPARARELTAANVRKGDGAPRINAPAA